MITKPTITLMFFLAPLLAGADPLDVYGNLTEKTVLLPSALPFLSDEIISDLPTEKTNAIARIESELLKQGIAVVHDGPHFVRVFPEKQRGFLTNVSLRGAELAVAKSEGTIATAEINIFGADLGQVLPIFASISQKTILRPATLPSPPLRLKSTCPLTREEAVYAMATVLALNGVAVVEDGEKFVQVAPMAQRAILTARAPKREHAAKLLDPNKVPSMGNSELTRPLTKMERNLERLQKALYDFIHYKSPPDRSAQRLLELYAKLAGKTAEPSKNFDGRPIWFHIETPLSKSELLYAIETTFSLNNLAIIHVDDQRVRLGHIAELRKGTGK